MTHVPAVVQAASSDEFAIQLHSLAEAEELIGHLTKFDLVVRLRLGQAYTQVERGKLYEDQGYKQFADYLKFSGKVQMKPTAVYAAMAVFQVFVEALDISPESLKARQISLGALQTIGKYAQITGNDPKTGFPIVANADQLRTYLDHAEKNSLSVRDLALMIENEMNPESVQSFFKITAIEKIGTDIFATFQEVSSTQGVREMGQLRFTENGFQTMVRTLKAQSRLLTHQIPGGISSLPAGAADLLGKT